MACQLGDEHIIPEEDKLGHVFGLQVCMPVQKLFLLNSSVIPFRHPTHKKRFNF